MHVYTDIYMYVTVYTYNINIYIHVYKHVMYVYVTPSYLSLLASIEHITSSKTDTNLSFDQADYSCAYSQIYMHMYDIQLEINV